MDREAKLSAPHALDFEPTPEIVRRFMRRVRLSAAGCWEWQGHKDDKGYGQFRLGKRAHWAHRVSYAIFRRPLIAGLTVEHKCRNPCCVNPWHHELRTVEENSRLQASANGHTPF